jgi:hypothetical protein
VFGGAVGGPRRHFSSQDAATMSKSKKKPPPRRSAKPRARRDSGAELRAAEERVRAAREDLVLALDAVACQWVYWLRLRLAEVFWEVDTVHATGTHPDGTATAVMLKTVLDLDTLGRIHRALEKIIDEEIGSLLDPMEDCGVQSLTAAARATAVALGLPGGTS